MLTIQMVRVFAVCACARRAEFVRKLTQIVRTIPHLSPGFPASDLSPQRRWAPPKQHKIRSKGMEIL